MNSIKKNRLKDKIFQGVGIISTLIGLVVLAIFIIDIMMDGVPRLNFNFLKNLPSRIPEKSGIVAEMVGTAWILFLTALFAFPLGLGAGIYLEKYAKKNKFTSLLEINIANLAGVPSIIYGLLGLEIFVRMLAFGSSLISGSLTLALLVLPIIVVATRESLKAVPQSIEDASYALGASKWQTIQRQLLPASFGGILTGVILALSRAVGETAPLIVIGSLAYVSFVPESPMSEFSVLPIRIFDWISRPQDEFRINAAAAIIILLAITFMMNGIAIYLRNKWQNKIKW